MDPAGWIFIPLVLLIGEGAQASFDVFASSRIVERAAQGLADERAATASPDATVKLLD